jgi:hypothetical protein
MEITYQAQVQLIVKVKAENRLQALGFIKDEIKQMGSAYGDRLKIIEDGTTIQIFMEIKKGGK